MRGRLQNLNINVYFIFSRTLLLRVIFEKDEQVV